MKFLVIGDSCIDIFRYGKVNRLAPEAPVPIIIPEKETSNPGMAGNVVKNIEALEHQVDFITNTTDIKKIRYVCSKYNHLLLRVDENDKCDRITQEVLDKINWEKYDAIIISDYCKGFLDENDIKYISLKHPLTFLDSKKLLGEWAHNISYIKINHHEYEKNIEILSNDEVLTNKTIITRGHLGCQFKNKMYPTKEVSVKDVSGAGDTFLSGLVVEYTRSKDIKLAINFAQECTTIVVQKIGVSTI
jgi:D-beta-D-heptose 7-phosphate kinase/D-beta-D-heptose 1-phosphate adenosyltransferase